jgi:hypothetical protein
MAVWDLAGSVGRVGPIHTRVDVGRVVLDVGAGASRAHARRGSVRSQSMTVVLGQHDLAVDLVMLFLGDTSKGLWATTLVASSTSCSPAPPVSSRTSPRVRRSRVGPGLGHHRQAFPNHFLVFLFHSCLPQSLSTLPHLSRQDSGEKGRNLSQNQGGGRGRNPSLLSTMGRTGDHRGEASAHWCDSWSHLGSLARADRKICEPKFIGGPGKRNVGALLRA